MMVTTWLSYRLQTALGINLCISRLKIVHTEPSKDPGGGGVLHNFQYGEVHANIWGLKFRLNQYLGSANYNMDKN